VSLESYQNANALFLAGQCLAATENFLTLTPIPKIQRDEKKERDMNKIHALERKTL
jgi:hypothetical protein